ITYTFESAKVYKASFKKGNRFILFAFGVLLSAFLEAQSVMISPEISLKNDFAYYVLKLDNGISVVRDRAYKLIIQNLDQDFNWSVEKNIELKGKKWRIIEVYSHHNNIGVLYATKLKTETVILYAIYDHNGIFISEKQLLNSYDFELPLDVNLKSSDDLNWVSLIFKDRNQEKWMCLYNRSQDSLYYTVKADSLFHFDAHSVQDVLLNNSGDFYILGPNVEQERQVKNKDFHIYGINHIGQLILDKKLQLLEKDIYDCVLMYQDSFSKLLLVGIYKEKMNGGPKGYLVQNVLEDEQIVFIEFNENLIKSLTGKTKKSGMSDVNLKIKNIQMKVDGSWLMFLENSRELSRKPYFNSTQDNTGFGPMKWVDYYYDDILVSCIDSNNSLIWEQVLPKKQYSQDDEGLFSSFFVMANTSFLRVIFNDEIKNESTVSEYILRSDGKFIRKSVLNTSYKNLNLRIPDAFQKDASTLVIPSESNGKMNLVQIILD
ncbi:MAG TPA: hypothetical protein PLD02_16625, partial [Saprospiraceae bacterium]|nr:hypothetical protein [Saprospiraceae bacterium]